MVSAQQEDGTPVDYTEKSSIESVIMETNEQKNKQSFDTPFMQPPLVSDFGYQGIGPASQELLHGTYIAPLGTEEFAETYPSTQHPSS